MWIRIAIIIVMGWIAQPVAAGMSHKAERYLEHALNLIQENALHAPALDWSSLRAQAREKAADAQTSQEVYPVIRYVLAQLKDHSRIVKEEDIKQSCGKKKFIRASGRLIAHHIAYIRLPALECLPSQPLMDRQVLNALMVRLGRKQPVGWIIDLRESENGNLWDMLAAFSMVLEPGVLGELIVQNQQVREWGVKRGAAFLGTNIQVHMNFPTTFIEKKGIEPLIAILVGPQTSRAAEIFARVLKQQKKAQLFGKETQGQPFEIKTFVLEDGARLQLVCGFFVDKNGHSYDSPLFPDIKTSSEKPTPQHDLPLNAALDWMLDELNVMVEHHETTNNEDFLLKEE